MDICLESFDYTVVNEGLADVGKKLGTLIEAARTKIKELFKRFIAALSKIKEKFKSGHASKMRKEFENEEEKLIELYFKNPDKYPDVEISCVSFSPDTFKDPETVANQVLSVVDMHKTVLTQVFAYIEKNAYDKTNKDPNRTWFKDAHIKASKEWFKSKFNVDVDDDVFTNPGKTLRDVICHGSDYKNADDYRSTPLEPKPKKLSELIKRDIYDKSKLTTSYIDSLKKLAETTEKKLDSELGKLGNEFRAKYEKYCTVAGGNYATILNTVFDDIFSNTVKFTSAACSLLSEYAATVFQVRRAVIKSAASKTMGKKHLADDDDFSKIVKEESYDFCSIV